MKQFNKIAAKKQANVITTLDRENFHGKRKFSVKAALCESALMLVDIDPETVDIEAMIAHVDTLKPVKVTAKKAIPEPLEPTFKGSETDRDSQIQVLPVGRYIISAVQNNTTAHPVFNSLVSHAESTNSRLLLLPIKYTTTLESLERKTPNYSPEFLPYLLEENAFIGSRKGVRLAVSAAILPTAKQAINTAQTLNNGEALTVVASPKNQLKTLVRAKGGDHRWAYTSMIATQRHYTDSRAGDEAEKAHTFGGVFLEVFENGMITHQELVSTETGEIYNPLAAIEHSQVAGLVAGDLHCEKMDVASLARLTAQIEKFSPHTVVLHDVLDFMSRNHHNRNSGRFLYQMGQRSVIDDLADTVEILNLIAALAPSVFIVFSNHDDALSQYLDCPHYKADQDVINAKTYYFLKYAILEFIDNSTTDKDLNCFEIACKELAEQVGDLAENIHFGELDEQQLIAGVDVGSHGHLGSGGARGSANTFKKYQKKMVVGHTHSPLKDGDLAVVGVTGSLEMGYNKGGSAWDRANALILDDGRTLLVPPYKINENQY